LRKNFAILLAFFLPVALITVVAVSIYLPSLFLSTNYNFVYSYCTQGTSYEPYPCDRYLQSRYSVINGKLVVNAIDPTQDSDKDGIPDVKENFTTRIFLHDTQKNESREIPLEEAETLTLNGLLTAPDGVAVSSHYDGGPGFFFVFSGRSSYGHYLTKGNSRSRLNLINRDDRYYYRDNFQFIGWVLPGRN
jgi:hypothetical protein